VTLKTRLSYQSPEYSGFRGLLEFDNVSALRSDYRAAPNGAEEAQRAVVADPEGTEVNQAWVEYKRGATRAKIGRQRINLNNQRFIGGVGFRQHEQTYNAFTLKNATLKHLSVELAYIDEVRRIFGEQQQGQAKRHEHSSQFINLDYQGFDSGRLQAYYIDLNNQAAPALSSTSIGLRFSGQQQNVHYTLELAQQSDAHQNPVNYTANSSLLEGGFKWRKTRFNFGREVLGEDHANGRFTTPLATLHKFQGWSDVFLGGGSGNVSGGIEDRYIQAKRDFYGVKTSVVYHQFSADRTISGGNQFGREYGLSFTLPHTYGSVSLKMSRYQAQNFGSDTSKLWLTLSGKF
jgi:hypothetical protein